MNVNFISLKNKPFVCLNYYTIVYFISLYSVIMDNNWLEKAVSRYETCNYKTLN